MAAGGMGFKAIAKTLNDEGVISPRPRRNGRPRSWTASSVRDVVMNVIYRGTVVWGRVKKRDQWGKKEYLDQPDSKWTVRQQEDLRIVSDGLWNSPGTLRLSPQGSIMTPSSARSTAERPGATPSRRN